MNISSAIIRYVFPGITLLVFFNYCCPQAVELFKKYSSEKDYMPIYLGIISIIGVLSHHLYHAVYSYFFTGLQDYFRTHSDNYRTYLKKQYKCSPRQAIVLFRYLRDQYFKQIYTEKLEINAAVIHYLYFIFINSIIFTLLPFLTKSFVLINYLPLAGFLSLVLGFVLDRNFEEHELSFIKSIDKEKLDDAASKILDIGSQRIIINKL